MAVALLHWLSSQRRHQRDEQSTTLRLPRDDQTQAASLWAIVMNDSVPSTNDLVELALQNPEAALSFLKATALLGLLQSLVLFTVSGCLCTDSVMTGFSSTQLTQIWFLGLMAIHSIQIPMRAGLLCKLRSSVGVEEKVKAVINSMQWQVSKMAATLSFAWVVVGAVGLYTIGVYPEHIGFCAYVIVNELKRCFLCVAMHRGYFPQTSAEEVDETKRATAEEEIKKLPLVRFDPALEAEDSWGHGCAVCICDFDVGDQLRKLPCGHQFHCECIDRWLHISRKCPLCSQDAAT